MTDFSLSIVVPMYNESDNVKKLINEIAQSVPENVDYEIIVVDDGSKDDTVGQLRAQQKEIKTLRILEHTHNAGQSAALISGVKHAHHAVIVTLDGDGQNDPNDITELCKLYLANQEKNTNKPLVVLGNRRKRYDTPFRRLSSRIANIVRRYFLKDNCIDTGCSLKLFPKDLFLSLPYFNHMHRFLPALFIRANATIMNVPVNHRPRHAGVSKYGLNNRLWCGIVDLMGVSWLMRRNCSVSVKQPHDKI